LSAQSTPAHLAADAPAPDAHPPLAPATKARALAVLAVFAPAVFLSAFLLFLVQPMFGKMVLPLLGGSPAVWNTCMLFFQAALLGGYLYAHLSSERLSVRKQAALHVGLLVLAGLLLPVGVAGRAFEGGTTPVAWLLLLMLTTVGPPFLVLSGTGPMLQRWFAHSGHPHAHDPYWLYAASNLGSMLALLGYPFVMEPRLRLAEQSGGWTTAYAALALLIGTCAWAVWRRPEAAAAPAHASSADDAAVPAREKAWWVFLAFVPSSLLLGVTTFLTIDLTPVPLLWVLPLALYLLSFTLVFARRPLIPHDWMVALQPSLLAAVALLLLVGWLRNPIQSVPIHLLALFVTAMVAHGELARRRPPVRHLTSFYLWISVGGVLGGVFNVLVAPVVFDRTWEYPLMLVAACLARPWPEGRRPWKEQAWGALRAAGFVVALLVLIRMETRTEVPALAYVGMASTLIFLVSLGLGRWPLWLAACLATVLVVRTMADLRREDVLLTERTFFGHYKVNRIGESGGFHALYHGSTLHGAQSLDAAQRSEPITYYVRQGPVGQIFASMPLTTRARRVAVVGLGTGTTAAYSQAGEAWDYYEIDPGIERIARDRRYFTYLSEAEGRVRVIRGDARLSLARASGEYDLIILDAFTSDAIPAHLLTREALGVYLERLAPGGRIAFHVSNRYLRLEPVVAALAQERGLAARVGFGPSSRRHRYESISSWVVVARSEDDLGPLVADSRWRTPDREAGVRPWTDDYSSILSVFNW
jgi:SAM-dependent methyltransferase